MIHLFEFKNEKRRLLFKSLLSLIFLFFLSQSGESGIWSINGSVQYFNGNYVYTASTSTYYLSSGLHYQSARWNVGVSIPVIAQNNNLVNGSGGMFLPSGHSGQGTIGNTHQSGGMMGGGRIVTDNVSSQIEFGLGDIYMTGQYQLVGDGSSNPLWNYGPSLAVSTQIKFPTASKDRNYGTGKFDYGMVFNLAERWKNYTGFLDLGYWLLGDTPEVKYQNPFTYGIGIGRFLSNGKFFVLLYYQGYSTILENYNPPRRGSLGFYYSINERVFFSTSATAGFSDTSPDFGLSVGINLSL